MIDTLIWFFGNDEQSRAASERIAEKERKLYGPGGSWGFGDPKDRRKSDRDRED